MRKLSELIDAASPAWPMVQEWLASARNSVVVLPASRLERDKALVEIQVTTRSPMGAVVHETGGLLVDHGWLRILGSSNAKLRRSLPRWNRTVFKQTSLGRPPFLLVADDAVGGFFAIDGGSLTGKAGVVCYFAPDSLKWEQLLNSYSDFLNFALSGDVAGFYEDFRWPGWRDELSSLPCDESISIYPYLWAEGPPLAERSRRAVPILDLWELEQEIAAQFNASGPTRRA